MWIKLEKGTKKYSILKLKCPRCQNGDLFTTNGLFVYKNILDMPDRCTHCNQDFRIESGFYSAALWISYPIELFIIVPTIISGFLMNSSYQFFKFAFPILILLLFILQPPIMRISRAILLNITVPYDPNFK